MPKKKKVKYNHTAQVVVGLLAYDIAGSLEIGLERAAPWAMALVKNKKSCLYYLIQTSHSPVMFKRRIKEIQAALTKDEDAGRLLCD